MRNIIRTALVLGTLASPMIVSAEPAKKEAPAAKDATAKDGAKDGAKDAKAPAKDAKDAKKDAAKPATK